MKSPLRLTALVLGLFLLIGCQAVTAPAEEIGAQQADSPAEGVPADPQLEAPTPAAPVPQDPALFPKGTCAVLPGPRGGYLIYDRYGKTIGRFQAGNDDGALSGLYPDTAVVGGVRLSTGKAADTAPDDAVVLYDSTGASAYSPTLRALTRYDEMGLPVLSAAPQGEDGALPTVAAILPFGNALLVSLWTGDGSATAPWRQQFPCRIFSTDGITLYDLSSLLSAPVIGVLGGRYLLTARSDSPRQADVYDLDGTCLAEGVTPLPEEPLDWGLAALRGGLCCEQVWKDGQVLSAELQPALPLKAVDGVTVAGDYLSGVSYNIGGIPSNGQLCRSAAGCAIWGIADGTLAIQWQGIDAQFPASHRGQEKLQGCSGNLGLSYAWDEDGAGQFRLFFFSSGDLLEYDCPAGQPVAAVLGDDYVLMMTASGSDAVGYRYRYRVVDSRETLRWDTDQAAVRPCSVGSFLLCRQNGTTGITDLDGAWLLTGGPSAPQTGALPS